MRTRLALAALALASLAAPLAVTAPALASGGDAVRTHGGCDGSPVWKMKAKPDDGRIEVEAEIDSNKVGQDWSWTFKDNGAVFATGTSTTTGPSGSFEVERKPANKAGTDSFVFRAVYPKSGEVCRATVSW